jgi:hypothetical protein
VTNTSNIVDPSSEWEPTSKTIIIRRWTWKRLQKYGTQYASTFDSIITDILNEKEGMSTPEGEGFILK